MRDLAVIIAFACIAVVACAGADTARRKVSTRAAFDLDCPAEQVTVVRIGDDDSASGTYGAIGCGRRISYDVHCRIGDCDIRAPAVTGAAAEHGKQ